MVKDQAIFREAYTYFDEKAPVLFFVLSTEGLIVKANRYAETITGRNVNGEKIRDLFVDFTGAFDLAALIQDASSEHLLHFTTHSGVPQSFYFLFRPMGDYVLTFGRLDSDELEHMRKEVLSLNQELNNVMRQLHKKMRSSSDSTKKKTSFWEWQLTIYANP